MLFHKHSCSPSPGTFRGVCKKIDHFPEDADYEADAAEYLLRTFMNKHTSKLRHGSFTQPC